MPELRVDTLSGLRVLFAPDAAWAPDTARSAPMADAGTGQAAHDTPVLSPAALEPPREAALDLFTSAAARGHHEVIAHPGPSLAGLSAEALAAAAGTWRERMAAHPDAAHVHLGVDEGRTADGALAQLWALDFVPAAVARERERASAYATRTQGSNLLGDLVAAEVRLRRRLVAYDDEAVLLAPFASQAPYQLMVVPRTPAPRFEEPGALGAGLLHRALAALTARFGGALPLSLWVRTAPRGATHFCWRIDLLPRLSPPSSLGLGTGVHRNPVLPEDAAAELRPLAGPA